MLLEINNIKLSFTNAHNETLNLLNGVTLGVEEGKITALVGGNGTGKTTLFNIISGFEKNYTGDIVFQGKNLNNLPPYRIARQGIGRLFQGGQLLEGLTLMENMKMAYIPSLGSLETASGQRPAMQRPKSLKVKQAETEMRARKIVADIFGVNSEYVNRMDDEASSFSYGQQRLLSLAGLLMSKHKLLLLDEPTSGVDPDNIEMIGNIIRDMVKKERLTVLLIEHNMRFVRGVADICAYLDKGIITKVGPAVEILDDEGVRNSYLGL